MSLPNRFYLHWKKGELILDIIGFLSQVKQCFYNSHICRQGRADVIETTVLLASTDESGATSQSSSCSAIASKMVGNFFGFTSKFTFLFHCQRASLSPCKQHHFPGGSEEVSMTTFSSTVGA